MCIFDRGVLAATASMATSVPLLPGPATNLHFLAYCRNPAIGLYGASYPGIKLV